MSAGSSAASWCVRDPPPLPTRRRRGGERTPDAWVTFFDAEDIEDEKPPLFSAAVDLVDRVVLHARAEPPIGSQMTEATDG